ncbi:DNA alkylation repair protein [Candidatus Woesearchaeota archaeon]|nr:DNA alkylation repair protein [Candidatus Woesearchaeota archaeon]
MIENSDKIHKELQNIADKQRALINACFFKTGKGEYGEGDLFLGITVPESRKIAKKYLNISFEEITQLLQSRYHEERLVALLILVERYDKYADQRKLIFDFYLQNTNYVNNWDLVDLSADKIIGRHLYRSKDDECKLLKKLVLSKNLWERRIAIISTFYYIKQNQYEQTLQIAELLVNDAHDLIHKAIGWMLREVGKRNQLVEEDFLEKYHKTMPRTMLRYAIERFDDEKKKYYMKRKTR